MNCEFCHKELAISHYERDKTITVYDCKNCPVLVSFHFNEDEERVKTCYLLDKNGNSYMWTINYAKNDSYIVDLTPTLSLVKDRDPMLVRFKKVMNINPNNVYEKFSFYLLFS